ncbi:hypothetical protein GCM10009718_15020 [Isoptericola halotolerans]
MLLTLTTTLSAPGLFAALREVAVSRGSTPYTGTFRFVPPTVAALMWHLDSVRAAAPSHRETRSRNGAEANALPASSSEPHGGATPAATTPAAARKPAATPANWRASTEMAVRCGPAETGGRVAP